MTTTQYSRLFEAPQLVTEESVNYILKGLAYTPAKEKSLEIVDDLRNDFHIQNQSIP